VYMTLEYRPFQLEQVKKSIVSSTVSAVKQRSLETSERRMRSEVGSVPQTAEISGTAALMFARTASASVSTCSVRSARGTTSV
jgi:hypothetical protein